jgi:hypothetical protein
VPLLRCSKTLGLNKLEYVIIPINAGLASRPGYVLRMSISVIPLTYGIMHCVRKSTDEFIVSLVVLTFHELPYLLF